MWHFRSVMASPEPEVTHPHGGGLQRVWPHNHSALHAAPAGSGEHDPLLAGMHIGQQLPAALHELTTRIMEGLVVNSANQNEVGTLGAGYNNSSTSPLDLYQGLSPSPKFNKMSLIKTVVLSLMFVVSMVCNTATLLQMYRMRRRRSTINTLIMHLAAADLIVTFFCNVTDAVWASTVQWYAGNSLCKLVKFLQVFGLYLSTYIIVIISVDRCYAILDPMSRNNAAKRVRILIAAAWSLSALFSLPQSYIFRVARGPFREEFYQCVTYGAYSAVWQEKLYSTLSVLLMFIIPLVTMVIAYMLIFCTIAKKSRDLQKEADTTTDMLSRGPMRGQLFRKAKVKSLQMTAVIVVAFIICWTPYYVVFIIFTFFDHNDINTQSSMWIFFFGMANSMFNPMILRRFPLLQTEAQEVFEAEIAVGNDKESTPSTTLGARAQHSQPGRGPGPLPPPRGTDVKEVLQLTMTSSADGDVTTTRIPSYMEQSPVQYPRPAPRTTCTKTSSSNRSQRSNGGHTGQNLTSPFLQKVQSPVNL